MNGKEALTLMDFVNALKAESDHYEKGAEEQEPAERGRTKLAGSILKDMAGKLEALLRQMNQ